MSSVEAMKSSVNTVLSCGSPSTARWLTERARTVLPPATDEVRTGLYFVDAVFWNTLPAIYRDLDHIKESFRKLVRLLPEEGLLIACGDSADVVDSAPTSQACARPISLPTTRTLP